MKIEKEAMVFTGAGSTKCAVSFAILLKLKSIEAVSAVKSDIHSPCSQHISVKKVDERSRDVTLLLQPASSSLSKPSLAVLDHHMVVSVCSPFEHAISVETVSV